VDESLLVDRARQGDPDAFGALVCRHEGHLYRFVYRFVTNDDDTRDVLQQVYIKAFRALPRARPDLNLAPWLRRIAANVSLDLLRRRKRRPEEPLDVSGSAALLQHTDPDSDPERHALRQETRRAVQQALAALSPRHRAALTLHEFDGLSCGEIAERAGLSRAGVKSLLFRARNEFRRSYIALGQ
jgi:RNA polymerase sigma-70 factor (ECF subfamily)